jgi:sugar lactone lactonase YvrE
MNDDATPQVVLDGLTFPEAPRWREGRLWFSDFFSHRVLILEADGGIETVVEVPRQPSGLGWTPEGRLLVVSMLDHKLLRLDAGGLVEAGDMSAFATGPSNDMVVDAAGRAYVGNFGYDRHHGEAERSAGMVCVDPEGGVTRVADELVFPNGCVITEDGATLIVAETFADRLTAFDIDGEGNLSGRRLFAALGGAYPDGICLDAEGAAWFADPRNNRVSRVFEGGRIDRTIATGERGAYACMLGGEDRRTLFICTNTTSGPPAAEAKAGRIETIRVDVPGAGLP